MLDSIVKPCYLCVVKGKEENMANATKTGPSKQCLICGGEAHDNPYVILTLGACEEHTLAVAAIEAAAAAAATRWCARSERAGHVARRTKAA